MRAVCNIILASYLHCGPYSEAKILILAPIIVIL